MTQLTNTPYEALEVGQQATYSKTVGEKDIQLFAAMSGDRRMMAAAGDDDLYALVGAEAATRCTWTRSSPPARCSRSASPMACSVAH